MNRYCRSILWLVLILISAPAYGQSGPVRAKEVEGELLVKFRTGTSNAARVLAHGRENARRLRTFRVAPNIDHVRLAPGERVQDAVARYRARPDVLYAEPNYVVEAIQSPQFIPNDPQLGTLWGMHNTGQSGGTPDADIDAPEAWNITTGSTDVVVVVLDTGIDYTHPDLAANMFHNPLDCDADGVDDDANGFADDCYGIDTANDDSDPMDDRGHGTHAAGTIGAVGNNGIGVAGVNWNVQLMACKFLGADGYGSTADAITCLDYVETMKERGINIVATSNSWAGGSFSQALYDAIEAQRQQGILFIAAAGNASSDNDNATVYPANYHLPNVISVAATTRTDSLAGFSNRGRRTVHLGAPGQDILSTTPGNTYSLFNGTSMATPHVSGVAALLKAQDPSRDWRAIKNLLLAGGDTIPALTSTITGKRLNAYGALTCSNSTVTSLLLPKATFVSATVGVPVTLEALNINCASPAGAVTATVNPGGSIVTLVDDGTSGDEVADDGVYAGQFTPAVAQTYTLAFSTGDTIIVGFPSIYNVTTTAYSYRTIAGTNLNLFDDTVAAVTSPFSLSYGGVALSTVYVGGNGIVSFSGGITDYFNQSLPVSSLQTVVAPFWDDLYPNGAMNVYWDVVGTAPHRELVIEWRDVPSWNCKTGGTVTFQAVFFESSSDILFNYADSAFGGACSAGDRGGWATVGVQVSPGAATQFSINAATIGDQMALLWTPQPVPSTPALSLVPGTSDFGTVAIGSHADVTFRVQNVGGGTLTGGVTTSAPFTIVSGGTFSLGPLASQPVVVRFAPTAVGSVARMVDVTSNATNLSAAVSGLGAVPTTSTPLGTFGIGIVDIALTQSPSTAAADPASALPPGLSIRADASPSAPVNTTASLSGVATTPGTYYFNVLINGAPVMHSLRVTALTIKDGNHLSYLPDAFVNSPYSYTLTALGNAGPVTWSATNLPANMNLSPGGVLSGTPTAAGTPLATITATDGIDTVTARLLLPVNAVNITTPGVLPNSTQGAAYSTTLTTSGGTGPYTFTTTSTLPSGLVLSSGGTISGTVSATTSPGPSTLSITVTDSNNVTYSKFMSLDVIGVPRTLPAVSLISYSPNLDDCTVGVICSRGVAVRSGGTAPFSWTATGLPPGVSLRTGTGGRRSYVSRGVGVGTLLVAGDAELWGVPTAIGSFDVTVTVTDAEGVTATNISTLKVSELAQPGPIATPTLNAPYTSTIRPVGGTPPYTGAHVAGQYGSTQNLPAGLTFNPTTLIVSGTPLESAFFVPVFTFTDANGLSVRLTESLDLRTAISINTGANLGATAVSSAYSRTLTASGATSYTWSVIGGTLPNNVTLTSGGLLSGTPSAPGVYTFLIKAANSSNASSFGVRQFTLNVVASGTVLSITTSATLSYGNVGTAYSRTLVATGGSAPLTWAVAPFNGLPPGLALSAAGVLDGTPTTAGQFSFTVSVTDGAQTAFTTFTVSIYPAGAYPPLTWTLGPNLGNFALGITTISFTSPTTGAPPYHYSLTPGATVIAGMRVQDGPPLPTNFTSTQTGGFIGVTTQAGTYPTSIRVTDALGATVDRAVTMTVVPHHLLSQSTLPRAAVGVPYSFSLEPYGGSGTYSWSATNLPPPLSLNASGQILGTPTTAGSYSPRVTLTDIATSRSISVTFTLAVDAFAITTSGDLPLGKVGTAYGQTLLAPACISCTWTAVSTIPAGLTLSGGVLSGTPTSTTSSSSFTIQASGTNGTAQKLFRMQIASATAQSLSIVTTSPLSDTTLGASTASSLLAQGGTPPYSWSLEAGSLPGGASLQGPGDALGASLSPGVTYLAGRPMQLGLHNFTLRVTDSLGASATRAFTWNISPIGYSYTSLPLTGSSLVSGFPYSQPLLALGGTGVYTNWTSTAMPPALILGLTSGLVSGQPLDTGSFTVPIQVTDDANTVFRRNVTFNVGGPTATLVSFGLGATLTTGQLGTTRTYDLSLSGGTAPYTVTALSPLPPGFSLLADASLLSNGTPGTSHFLAGTPLVAGTYVFTIRATDSLGNIGVRTFTLSVAPFALFTSTTLPDASVGAIYSQPLITWDSSGPVSWSVSPTSAALPPGLNPSPAGILSGTPLAAGNYTFTLNATDASGVVVSYTFSLRVSNIAIISPQVLPFTAISGVSFTNYQFTSVGGAGAVTWSATGLPSGVTLSSTGALSGGTTASGSFTFVITATDGVIPVARRFTLFSRVPNATPLSFTLASTALADAIVGQNVSYFLSATSGTPPYAWGLAPGSALPPGLVLLPAEAIGSPIPSNFTPGLHTVLAGAPTVAGSHEFDLIVTDASGAQIRRTFSLTVTTFGILSGSMRTAFAGVAYAQRFTPVGGNAPFVFNMRPVSAVQDMLPPGFAFSQDGLLAGTTSSTGTYSFVLTVTDGTGATFSRTYSFNVTTASGLFISNTNPTDAWVGGASVQTLSVGGAPVGTTFTWSVVSGALPPGMALVTGSPFASVNGTLLAGQPTTADTYSYTLRASDDANGLNVAEHIFTITVAPHQVVFPAASDVGRISTLPLAEIGTFYSTRIRAAGGLPPYTFSVSPFSPLPDGLVLSDDGTLSGTPEIGGNFQMSLTIVDAAGMTLKSASVFLIVLQPGMPVPLRAVGVGTLAIDNASAGNPYGYALDGLLRAGTPPYSWTIESGSLLPDGLTILTGSNGVSSFLVGTPTTPGTYVFSLIASDASGQTLTIPVSLTVSIIGVLPDSLPPGTVGAPYSVLLSATGGVGPYTYQVAPTFDLPGGLTLSGAGVLEGMPTHAGNFIMWLLITDVAGATFTRGFEITFDNAASEAPAVTLSPRSIEIDWTQGSAAPGPVPVSINATSGAIPFKLSTGGIPGAMLSANSGAAPSTVDLTVDVTGLATGSYRGVIAVSAEDSANQLDWVGVTLNVLPVIDSVAPDISPVSDLVVEATAPGGAVVTFSLPAVFDNLDPVPIVSTAPASGSLFPLGTSTVTVTALDASGNTSYSTFQILVRDTVGPVLSLPAQLIAEATGAPGAAVAYVASATDVVTGPALATCDIPSGSVFPSGSTTVTCTATDENENDSSAAFVVVVQDTTAPLVQVTSPATDALFNSPTVDVTAQASDIVGVATVTINGVAAARIAGSGTSGSWRASVPIVLPMSVGGALSFAVAALDAAGNSVNTTRILDNDGIPAALDRSRSDASDQSDRFSSDFNNGTTKGTITRSGWTTKVSNGATANSVRVQATGSGTLARVSACVGVVKEVRLDVVGETADIACDPLTGTITVKALSAAPRIEVWKQISPTTWTIAQLPTGATYSTGSPATASPRNTAAISVDIVQLDDAGQRIVVGNFNLAPGASVDVGRATPGVGPDQQMHLRIRRGRVPVTVDGRTRIFGVGQPVVMTIPRPVDAPEPPAATNVRTAPSYAVTMADDGLPFAVQLKDADGKNQSSGGVAVRSLRLVSEDDERTFEVDGLLDFDIERQAYRLNFEMRDVPAGSYRLVLLIDGDPVEHKVTLRLP